MLAGMDDFNGQAFAPEDIPEAAAKRLLRPYEMNPDGELTAGEDRSAEFGLGRLIRTHGIESDVNQH
ncbi:hypothetical protein GCM10011586_12420 [Silvibacterium dinghuense]|nr:hypothetical protein GCM10011586_12420 [Silvibacterium dinghuense]